MTSVPFIIKNSGPDTVNYNIQVKTTAISINPIQDQSEIFINPRGQTVFIVPLHISQYALTGKYTIQLLVTDSQSGTTVKQEKNIFISSLEKIALTKITGSEYVRAGDTVKATFLLQNEGNIEKKMKLSTNGDLSTSPTQIDLKPGESRIIQINQATMADIIKNDHLALQLTATTNDSINNQWIAYHNATVISIHPKEEDIFLRFPIEASLSYISQRQFGTHNGGLQAEIYGKGTFNKKAGDLLEFHAVTPSPIPFNSYSKYEEYFANYQNKNLYVHIGDKSFSSSYLTEYYRYGRGAALEYSFNRFTIGGFFNHPRFFQDIKNEYNLFSRFTSKKRTVITVGYLYKIPNDDSLYYTRNRIPEKTQLPYITVQSDIWKRKLSMEAEAAYSHTLSTAGTGYRIQLNSLINRFSGNLQYLKTSPEFNGYFRNSNAINSNINYRISKKLSFSANYNQDAQNIQKDTLYLSAPYRKSHQLGMSYQYLTNGNFSFYGGNRSYKDRMKLSQFNYDEKFLRFSVDQTLKPFTVGLETQLAKTDNHLTRISENSQYYTLSLGIEKWNSSLNMYGSFANTSRYQQIHQKVFYYGARLQSRLSSTSYLNIFYQNNYQPEEYYKNRNLFEVQYHQSTFKNQAVELSGRYTLQQGQLYNKDYVFAVKYMIRLGLPVQRIANYSSVTGCIHSKSNANNGGIRIWLGNHSTLSDPLGNFAFKNVIPGDYMLDIDGSTLRLNEIPAIEFPKTITVKQEPLYLNFSVTEAARIAGSILLDKEKSANSQLSQILPTENHLGEEGQIIIEATNEKQTFRQLCALGSKFEFNHLRPGNWIVNVYSNGLNKNYKILDNKYNFDLKPGSIEDIQIHVVKKQMNIQFQQGEIKVSYDNK